MLADRFQLKVHRETTQEPVYVLVPDKKGMKLKATDLSSCVPPSPDVTFTPNGTGLWAPPNNSTVHISKVLG